MILSIATSQGLYKYKLNIVYWGIKQINKVIAKENLLLFNEIAKKHNLRFGLAYGTLLGAIREHDFIIHDEDIDLFILSEELDKLKGMLFELRENGFEVIRYDRRDGLLSIIRKGEYIDFYVFAPLIPGMRAILGDPMPEKYYTNLMPIEFMGTEFLISKDYEEHMILLYGENWRTPIKYNNYAPTKFEIMKAKISWWIYYRMPNILFYPWVEKRAQKKIIKFNRRTERVNKYYGREVLHKIPLNCYKAR